MASAEPSEDEDPLSEPLAVSAEEKILVLTTLANPERNGLDSLTWFALTPSEALCREYAAHCLPALLAPVLSDAVLERSLLELRITGPSALRAETLAKLLLKYRDEGLEPLIVAKTSTSYRSHRVHWVSYGEREPSSTPDAQLAANARGEACLAKTHRALLARRPQTRGGPSQEQAEQRQEEMRNAVPDAPAPRAVARRLSLGAILAALDVPKPYLDPSGAPLPAQLLSRTFETGFEQMSVNSGGRRQLVLAASTAIHHVLRALAPDPLATAAAVAEPPKRPRQADPMRLALSAPKPAKNFSERKLSVFHSYTHVPTVKYRVRPVQTKNGHDRVTASVQCGATHSRASRVCSVESWRRLQANWCRSRGVFSFLHTGYPLLVFTGSFSRPVPASTRRHCQPDPALQTPTDPPGGGRVRPSTITSAVNSPDCVSPTAVHSFGA